MTQDAKPAARMETVQVQARLKSEPGQGILHVNIAASNVIQGVVYLDFGMIEAVEVEKAKAASAQTEGPLTLDVPTQIRLAMPLESMIQIMHVLNAQIQPFVAQQQGNAT